MSEASAGGDAPKHSPEQAPERPLKRVAIAFDAAAVKGRLVEGIDELRLSLSKAQIASLTEFVRVLHAANQIHNLSGIRDPLEMAAKHVLDSLSVLPYLATETLIDVGSGGGVPGLPLLIASGCQRVVMIDSVGKKMRAVAAMAQALGLHERTTALAARVETLAPNAPEFSGCRQIIARAFSSLETFVTLAGPLLAPRGELLAMKGSFPEDELKALPKGWRLAAHHTLSVPFVDAPRCLLVLVRV
jgi:16S rRNA (guanine527-N7)-methyltransferase